MKIAESTTTTVSHTAHQQSEQPFFQKLEEQGNSLFSKTRETATPFFSPATIQPKLKIGQLGDKYEQEADAMADQVMQSFSRQPIVQAKCAECAEDEKVQMMEGEKEGMRKGGGLQRMAIFESNEDQAAGISPFRGGTQMKSNAPNEASVDLQTRLNASKGRGQTLSDDTRSPMESAFGKDFSSVRVHTGSEAVQMNQELGAQAFTHGSDVYFNEGKYRPETTEGQRLLGHELTHVVQQGGGKPISEISKKPIDRSAKSTNNITAPTIQRTCGIPAATIGQAANCTGLSSNPVGDRVLFRVNCDDFKSNSERAKVQAFADSMTETDIVTVHGFASIDGPLDFNMNLSCARALRVANLLELHGILPSQINMVSQGPTPGAAQQMRSVVLERDPDVSRPVVPQLDAVTAGPVPGNCGIMNYVVAWQLSRNAGAKGGFVLQDITITWDNRDCAGTVVPDASGKTSPLRYFEIWRVAPNSQIMTPVNTDTFAWVNDLPSGCTVDRVSFRGIATYHDELDNSDIPAHMIVSNPATFAGGLRSSTTDPNLGGNISRPFTHNLTFSWDCCPCQSSQTVVEEAIP